MDCAACTCRLKRVNSLGIDLDTCPKCGGVWFDKGEATTYLDRLLAKRPDLKAAAIPASSPREPDERSCPRCDESTLLAFSYRLDAPLILHRCTACGGVWADKGEVTLLARLYAEKPLPSKLGGK